MVRLSIMGIPEDREACFRRLLELRVRRPASGRPVEDLDPGEIIDLILWTSEKADHYDDILLEEFGYEHEL